MRRSFRLSLGLIATVGGFGFITGYSLAVPAAGSPIPVRRRPVGNVANLSLMREGRAYAQ